MKNKLYASLVAVFLFAGVSFAQDAVELATETGPIVPILLGAPNYAPPDALLYDNGPLVNAPGGGFGGADASVLQTALAMSTYGFGHQVSANNSVADDFTVPSEGWQLDQVQFFAYQTGSTTTSTITEVRVRIWNGDPTAGGTIIWGDLTTNVMSATAFSNIYRSIDTNPTASNRPIMVQTCNIGLALPAGTYWIEWMTNGSLSSGPWAPPITINGQTTTGNAKQNLNGTWGNAIDTGSGTQQGFPFILLGTVLPVELTSFTAAANNNNVVLNWSTATEVNNRGFEVERKSGEEFTTVGFVQGHLTTTEAQNYSFVDKGLEVGKYTYRLKQIDVNGHFEYSNAIEVEVVAPKEFALEQNYPNPFNPSTKIVFSLAVDSKVSLKVFNVLGQQVAQLLNSSVPAGLHEINFNGAGLNSGVYFYEIEANGVDGSSFSSVKKMILNK
ncbi:MAG: T9SS type A sorting domain-containing protein [Ignavibacteriaceae bacterium]|nr:T9SS type A sorting domain-containing protein [Ignavibacteriaceae bacterium]